MWVFEKDAEGFEDPLEAVCYSKENTVYFLEEGKVLWVADATRTLHEFALWCAEEALEGVDNPHPRNLEAIRVKRLWLDGEATDEGLEEARRAAYNASLRVAYDLAWEAVWDVAYDATCSVAWEAAYDVAWWSLHSPFGEAHSKELERRLLELRPEPKDLPKKRSVYELLDEDLF